MSNRLCFVFRRPALYREPIHRLMEESFDADWYFGDDDTNIKCYDVALHKHVEFLKVSHLFAGLYRAKGELGLLFRKEYDTFLMLNSTHNVSVWLFALCKRLFFPKKRVYYWCHGWYGKESKSEKLIKKILFKAADGIFTYGEYARDLMIKEGLDGTKIFPIHNSLDYDCQLKLRQSGLKSDVYLNHFGNQDPVLVFIGRLTPVKELDRIVDALSLLRDEGKSLNLVFIGDGAERQRLESMVCERFLEGRVWFYGACYDEKTNAELLYNADLCVAPGNIGLTAMHCMVFGTPALTHDCFKWQMPEFEAIKEGKTGGFFKYKDTASLASAIERWFQDHHDREAVRKSCFAEIDMNWTPAFQLEVLKKHIEL